jgi:AcrR family transcriptional regulator
LPRSLQANRQPTEDSAVPRTKQRTGELRDHIVQVAVSMLAVDGVGGFTTRKVAEQARTSPPAVYELFGDKGGLLREVFFAGFRLLHERLATLVESDDPRADLLALLALYRRFVAENPVLAQVMFSRPFTDFDPRPAEREASGSVRLLIVAHVRRCIDARQLYGDETDLAHALVALVQGLALAEQARRLGSTRKAVDRRWTLALEALLDGLAPAHRIDR